MGSPGLELAPRDPERLESTAVNLGPEINSPERELSPKLMPHGKYLIWTSCRLPALAAKPPKRTTDQVLQELRAPGNGIGNIYLIDVSAVPALKDRASEPRVNLHGHKEAQR